MAKKGKASSVKTYPQSAQETSNLFSRVEPFLTPSLFRSRFLQGLEQALFVQVVISDGELKDQISRAANEVEMLLNVSIYPVQHREYFPHEYIHKSNGFHIKTAHGPILSVEDFVVVDSNQGFTVNNDPTNPYWSDISINQQQDPLKGVLFRFPPQWISMGYAHKRQLNILPWVTSIVNYTTNTGVYGGSIPVQSLLESRWISCFYRVDYTAGMVDCEGNLPIIVNELIGLTAAIKLLRLRQARFLYTSQSLSQDGISQSSSGPGNLVYKPLIDAMEADRDKIMERLKMLMFSKYYVGNL